MDWNRLIEVFLKKNSELNLSAIRDEKGVRLKHIDDSLKILDT
jgi:16S rRNA G527 N7-methylase RsmG